jgi:hypothetical protein
VHFIRKNGRVIPIHDEKDGAQKKAAAVAAGTSGAVVALDAARTKRVYNGKRFTMDRKQFTFQPFAGAQLGDTLVMHDKASGKRIGQARYYVEKASDVGSFSWLGIKKPFRGKGMSKTLARQAGVELRAKGAKSIMSHPVHPGSVLSQYDRKRDKFWLDLGQYKDGDRKLYPLTKKEALERVGNWKKASDKMPGGMLGTMKQEKKLMRVRAVFRETMLPRTIRRSVQPFRTLSNKVRLFGGAGLALGAAAYLLSRKKDRDGKQR